MDGGYFSINSITISSINLHIRKNLFGFPIKNLSAKFWECLSLAEDNVCVIACHPCRKRRYKGLWSHFGPIPMIIYCLPACPAFNDLQAYLVIPFKVESSADNRRNINSTILTDSNSTLNSLHLFAPFFFTFSRKRMDRKCTKIP